MAAELGARMESHSHCEQHPARDAIVEAQHCPFCADYLVWQKWAQREIRALRLDRVRANTTKETSG
jgi:hypothetical protein